MSAHLSLTDWSLEPTVLLGLAALVVVYGAALRRGAIARHDDVAAWMPSPLLRPVCFGLGVLVALVALVSPIDTGGDQYLLCLHMLQHLLLMMVAPPLLLLGVAGMRAPAPSIATRSRRLWTWGTRPWPAVIIFNAVMLMWHIPALYGATLTNQGLHIVEHLTFTAVGIVFWWPVVDPVRGATTREVSPMQKIAMLGLAGVPPTAVGFVFALGGTPYYDFYARAPRLWGVSPVLDQQIAGVLMFGLGNVIYFVALSVVFLRMIGEPEHEAEPLEQALR